MPSFTEKRIFSYLCSMILIIDDDLAVRKSLVYLLEKAGYTAKAVEGPPQAVASLRTEVPQLILMDMNFSLSTSGEEGLRLLSQVKRMVPGVPVILMTAWGSIDLAVKGMHAGAFDFLTKPWDNLTLVHRVSMALELTASPAERVAPDESVQARHRIIGCSQALREVMQTIQRVAPTQASVLITGESGTGKELVAEALHAMSRRRGRPFVKVNLGGMSASLFESEMFGYRKGAFTGADCDRQGRFDAADGGTIFLDEIGELPLSLQVKMLRVLQEQTFEPLGDTRPHRVDVRVVCATNANLPLMVQQHTFREDLLYRINLIEVHLPPLRERREDIPLLVRHFASSQGMPDVSITDDAMQWLSSLPYPGNIRQLKNLVQRTLLLREGDRPITAADFRLHYDSMPQVSALEPSSADSLQLDALERQAIQRALARYSGNLTQAALALGISRQSLYRRMEKHQIPLP